MNDENMMNKILNFKDIKKEVKDEQLLEINDINKKICDYINDKDETIKNESQLHSELMIKDEEYDEIDLPEKKKIRKTKLYSCDFCNGKFNLNNLSRHKRIHTGEKPFSCDVCKKKFGTKPILVQHKRIHTGEKPFSCNICNKKFSDKSSLFRHKRIHTGEKPFLCDICNKKFISKSYLIQHHRVHSGEKPFCCDICDKSFNQQSSLARHKRTHNGKKIIFVYLQQNI